MDNRARDSILLPRLSLLPRTRYGRENRKRRKREKERERERERAPENSCHKPRDLIGFFLSCNRIFVRSVNCWRFEIDNRSAAADRAFSMFRVIHAERTKTFRRARLAASAAFFCFRSSSKRSSKDLPREDREKETASLSRVIRCAHYRCYIAISSPRYTCAIIYTSACIIVVYYLV